MILIDASTTSLEYDIGLDITYRIGMTSVDPSIRYLMQVEQQSGHQGHRDTCIKSIRNFGKSFMQILTWM